jgi:hypothetical protein
LTIPRFQLFELEDLAWYPRIIRDLATDYLQFIEVKLNLHRPVVPLLADALRRSGSTTVVDLCAGGGGPVAALRKELADAGLNVRFILTDKFPNVPAFQQLSANDPAIEGFRESVDATDVPRELTGFRTVFNAFHHFKPGDARAVLQSAVTARQPIGVFEIPERKIWIVIATVLFTPAPLIVTPFIRPFRWTRLLFTYLIPLVPLTCLWDGFVSQLRAYTPDELAGLASSLGDVGYQWNAGKVSASRGSAPLTYLIGLPDSGR